MYGRAHQRARKPGAGYCFLSFQGRGGVSILSRTLPKGISQQTQCMIGLRTFMLDWHTLVGTACPTASRVHISTHTAKFSTRTFIRSLKESIVYRLPIVVRGTTAQCTMVRLSHFHTRVNVAARLDATAMYPVTSRNLNQWHVKPSDKRQSRCLVLESLVLNFYIVLR